MALSLMTVYAPSPDTIIPVFVMEINFNDWFSDRKGTDIQRKAAHRIRKRMDKGPIQKVTVYRYRGLC